MFYLWTDGSLIWALSNRRSNTIWWKKKKQNDRSQQMNVDSTNPYAMHPRFDPNFNCVFYSRLIRLKSHNSLVIKYEHQISRNAQLFCSLPPEMECIYFTDFVCIVISFKFICNLFYEFVFCVCARVFALFVLFIKFNRSLQKPDELGTNKTAKSSPNIELNENYFKRRCLHFSLPKFISLCGLSGFLTVRMRVSYR